MVVSAALVVIALSKLAEFEASDSSRAGADREPRFGEYVFVDELPVALSQVPPVSLRVAVPMKFSLDPEGP